MLNKKLLLFLVILFISISAASANSLNDTTTISNVTDDSSNYLTNNISSELSDEYTYTTLNENLTTNISSSENYASVTKSIKENSANNTTKQNITINYNKTAIYANEKAQINATILSSTGTAVNISNSVFKINGVTFAYSPIINGKAQYNFTVPRWEAKDRNITIKIGETSKYYAAELNDTLTMYKLNTAIILDKTNYTVSNGTINITAHIYDNLTNPINWSKVAIKINQQTIGTPNVKNGLIELLYAFPSSWKTGIYQITIKYGENSLYYASTTDVNVFITNNQTSTTNKKDVIINYNNTYVYAKENASIKAYITDENGNAISLSNSVLKINDKTMASSPVVNGVAIYNFTIPEWSAKNITMNIKTGETTKYNEAIENRTLIIYKLNSKITVNTTNYTANNNVITITANIKDNLTNIINRGTVAFKLNQVTIGTVNVTNGKASINYTLSSTFQEGKYLLTIKYGENSLYKSSQLDTNITINYGKTYFTYEQINKAANNVHNYVVSNGTLPENVIINNQNITMEQLLYLMVYSLNSTNNTTLPEFTNASNDLNNMTSGNINKTEYTKLANEILSYMNANTTAPSSIETSLGTLSFNNTVEAYTRILSYNYNHNYTLPSYVSFNTTVDFIYSDILEAANRLYSYYLNHSNKLPQGVTINGHPVYLSDFLYLMCNVINSTENVRWVNFANATNATNSLSTGKIYTSEYVELADSIISYMDTNKKAPSTMSTSLGTMKFDTLINLYLRALTFKYENSRLPNYISFNATSS